jgi:Zn-dependent peptidase ImmA (M78 family)
LVDHHDGALPEQLITGLPKVQVERFSPLPVSGATEWSNGRWLVLLNGSEPATRQRFSMAHELKHILDHRFIKYLYEGIPAPDRAQWIEHVCDYFAGCLLMPRPALKRAYVSGLQDAASLAAYFDVSPAAVQVRLSQTGLSEPTARCDRASLSWAFDTVNQNASRTTYHRAATAVAI